MILCQWYLESVVGLFVINNAFGFNGRSSRSVYAPHLVQSMRLFSFKYRGVAMLTGFPRSRWPRRRFSESYAVRISMKISRICEFRVIMVRSGFDVLIRPASSGA